MPGASSPLIPHGNRIRLIYHNKIKKQSRNLRYKLNNLIFLKNSQVKTISHLPLTHQSHSHILSHFCSIQIYLPAYSAAFSRIISNPSPRNLCTFILGSSTPVSSFPKTLNHLILTYACAFPELTTENRACQGRAIVRSGPWPPHHLQRGTELLPPRQLPDRGGAWGEGMIFLELIFIA